MCPWNRSQYQLYSGERLRPALDLLSRISLEQAQLIYDLGCGTGNITQLIKERWPEATVYGLDSSAEMLKATEKTHQNINWIQEDLEKWIPDKPPDLIYANASLHWLSNHEVLLPRLFGYLKPGGCLAVQMPRSWGSDSHRLMRETLENGGPGGRPLGNQELREAMSNRNVENPTAYYEILRDLTNKIDIWETEYLHILKGEDPIFEWVKSTGLQPILNGLNTEDRERFTNEYKARLRQTYPKASDGRTLYPFKRLFFLAHR